MFYLYKNVNNEGWELAGQDEDREVLQALKVELSQGTASGRDIGRTANTIMFKIRESEMDPSKLKA